MSIAGNGTTPTAGSPYRLICTVPVIGWNGSLTIQLTAPNGSVLTSNVVSASPGMTYTLQWSFSPLHTSDGGQYSCVVSYESYTLSTTNSSVLVAGMYQSIEVWRVIICPLSPHNSVIAVGTYMPSQISTAGTNPFH